jgi:hypothetical protein
VLQSGRRQEEWFQAAFIAEYDRNGGGSFMAWEAISLNGRTDLVLQTRGTWTGKPYIDNILDNQVRLYAGAVGDQFILMNDKACPYMARVVQNYLERESIERRD